MQLGYFTQPSHPPERDLKAGFEWDLQVLRWLDTFGYIECWIGEHHTSIWEPNPAPDLLAVEGFRQTERLRIGPGGFLLPYHHPAELANRLCLMDHLSDGRLNFGVAASGLHSDWKMFGVDGHAGVNRDMTRESLEIILKLWSDEPTFEYKGKYWHVTKAAPMYDFLYPHFKPKQKPHPPIGVAGLSGKSETLKIAGERGYLPLSQNLNPAYVASHWDAVEEGARRVGRTPDKRDWRLLREVVVAETDAKAWKLAVEGPLGRMMGDYFIPLFTKLGVLDFFKHDPAVPDSDVTVEYCARHNWMVGSPATVAEKLEAMYEGAGGFGQLLVFGFDYSEMAGAWETSLGLLANEVLPKVAHLTPPAPAAAA